MKSNNISLLNSQDEASHGIHIIFEFHDNDIHIENLYLTNPSPCQDNGNPPQSGPTENKPKPIPTDPTENGPRPLPAELDTHEGRRLLSLAQEKGWLDSYFQPTGLKKGQMALIASRICDLLGIVEKWSIFENFWGIDYLAQNFKIAMDSDKQHLFYCEICDIIR